MNNDYTVWVLFNKDGNPIEIRKSHPESDIDYDLEFLNRYGFRWVEMIPKPQN